MPSRTGHASTHTAGATLLCLALCLAVMAAPVRADEECAAPDCAALFEWFEGLESYDAPLDRPWVRVWTGHWVQGDDGPVAQAPDLAFLLAEEGDTFTVLFTNLLEARYTRTGPEAPIHERVDFEIVDPAAETDALLEAVRAPVSTEERRRRRFGARLQESAELFVVASACHRQGLESQARALCVEASRLAREPGAPADLDLPHPLASDRSLREALEASLAHAGTWRLVEAFGERMSRRELLAASRTLAAEFPGNPHAPRVAESLALLEQMVAEDEARASLPARPWESLTPDEQITDLIFRLRDQSDDPLSDSDGAECPAARLETMGFAAVPRLIAALDDPRYTRWVECHRTYYFSHSVVRVGEVAETVLSRIAGRTFRPAVTTAVPIDRDEVLPLIRAEAQAWWADVQQRGEATVLAEGVRRGGWWALPQAQRLLQREPGAAADALLEGIRQTEEPRARTRLVEFLGRVDGEAAVEALRLELHQGPTLASRVAAARGLFQRGKHEALTEMTRAWRASSQAEGEEDAVASLAAFLLDCGEVEAVTTVGDGLSSRPLEVRQDVVMVLAGWGASELSGETSDPAMPAGAAEGTRAWQEAVEALLVTLLEDVDRMEGQSGNWHGKDFADPRIADLAGHVLTTRWPERYAFDLAASEGLRERQRLASINRWREGKGLDPLPIPEPRTIARTPPAQLTPLLAAASGPDDAAREDATIALEAHGLAALPGILEHAFALRGEHPARAPLLDLASRLGAIVSELEVHGPAPTPGSALARAIEEVRGSPLTAEGMVQILVEAARALPEGARGIRIEVQREADLTGLTVRIGFEEGEAEEDPNDPWWSHGSRVRAGTRTLYAASGASELESLQEERGWEDEWEAIDEALALPPERALFLRFTLSRRP